MKTNLQESIFTTTSSSVAVKEKQIVPMIDPDNDVKRSIGYPIARILKEAGFTKIGWFESPFGADKPLGDIRRSENIHFTSEDGETNYDLFIYRDEIYLTVINYRTHTIGTTEFESAVSKVIDNPKQMISWCKRNRFIKQVPLCAHK